MDFFLWVSFLLVWLLFCFGLFFFFLSEAIAVHLLCLCFLFSQVVQVLLACGRTDLDTKSGVFISGTFFSVQTLGSEDANFSDNRWRISMGHCFVTFKIWLKLTCFLFVHDSHSPFSHIWQNWLTEVNRCAIFFCLLYYFHYSNITKVISELDAVLLTVFYIWFYGEEALVL